MAWDWDLFDPQPNLGAKETVALKRSAFTHNVAIKASEGTNAFAVKQNALWSCAYDKNCSELYRAIEHERWIDVAQFLDSSSWPGMLSIVPDFSPKQQALTLVNQLTDDGNSVIWSLLPLHIAILRRAPFPVIGRLIDLAPQTLIVPDHKGNLALHYAMTVPSCNKALAYILTNSPECIQVTNSKNLTPLECALASKEPSANNLGQMIQFFSKQFAPPKGRLMVKRPDFVCDMPSPLYKEIQKKDWKSVSHFLRTFDWPSNWIIGLFDSLTNTELGGSGPEEQVKAMVECKDENGKVVRADLPIHLAIIKGAPLDIVGQLVDIYPKSLRIPDNQGMLPLHLALYHDSSNDVIAYLLESFPASAGIKSLYSRYSPIEVALKCNNKARGEILQHFLAANKQCRVAAGTTLRVTLKE